jgi:hypothetical protein
MTTITQRKKYSAEQNQFIVSCFPELEPTKDQLVWNEVAKRFNEKFPDFQPSSGSAALQNHYFQSLNSIINRGEIPIEEYEFINKYLSEKGKH